MNPEIYKAALNLMSQLESENHSKLTVVVQSSKTKVFFKIKVEELPEIEAQQLISSRKE